MTAFEDRLWDDLVRDHGAAAATGLAPSVPVREGPRRAVRLTARARLLLASAAAVALLTAAGATLLGPSGRSLYIATFECAARGDVGYSGALVDPDPISACHALWPTLYRHAAPPLAAWSHAGRGVVLVTPSDSPPTEAGWTRLPAGWTADSALIELTDQLQDITTGYPAASCLSPASGPMLARSVLRSDGLSWRVGVDYYREAGRSAFYSPTPDPAWGARCLFADPAPTIDPAARAILVHLSPHPTEAPIAAGATDAPRLISAERRANAGLARPGRCATPAQAAALWRSEAHAAGVAAVYNLYASTAAARRGCARVIVNVLGGGGVNVLAVAYP